MKARLEFDLSDLEDAHAHACAIAGVKAMRALWALDEHLRQRLKYGDLPEPVLKEVGEIRTLLSEHLEDLPDHG